MVKICLDPGHGGRDLGAIGQRGTREADINLSVAKQVRDILSSYMQVIMIRENDTTVELTQRPIIANNENVNAYVSIHCNAVSNPSAKGIETYSYPDAPNGKLLATAIHNRVVPVWGLVNRGLKVADFCVLRETNMAAALIEMAFISNPDEEVILLDVEKQKVMALAIAQGIMDYFGLKFTQQPADTPIMHSPRATVEQAKQWAKNKNANQVFIDIADIYWKLAPAVGVDPAVAYAQCAKETAFCRFGGVIDATYCNPCGLKTTAGGGNYDPNAHKRFASWDEGIQAHIDHLALYAGANGYPKSNSPDPRHFPYIAGKAPTVESLGGKWAPSVEYGQSIVEQYLKPMIATVVEQPKPKEPESAYPDTKAHWIDGTLRELKAMGITFGNGDGMFRPEEPATRAEMVAAIYKMIKLVK